VLDRAKGAIGCGFQEPVRLAGPTELQIGPVRSWPAEQPSCSSVGQPRHVFATPLGFLHASELNLRDWRATLQRFSAAAQAKFAEVQRKKKQSFVDLNNHFFSSQDTNPFSAMRQPGTWPELYSSSEYKEWARASRDICTSFISKLGIHLSKEEAEDMELVTWAAVYPKKSEPVTHYYHAHQESIVSFVLYVKMPEPVTPLTISDPRGAPPVEDFEWFQDKGDMGVDGDPPFHRPMEFYAEEGDILIFPSFAIHKVPPHIGESTRVVFPTNCHLPKRPRKLSDKFQGRECPLDGWERIARWQQAPTAFGRPVAPYVAHAQQALALAQTLEDPYMKMWEVQNQVLAVLQFGALDARAWLAAGNASALAAVVLDSRNEGEYYLDAALMFAQALRLDPGIKPELDLCLDQLVPKKVRKQFKDAYRNLAQWRKLVKSWGTSPPEAEVTLFLHPEVNGDGRCQRMCAANLEPVFRTLRILPVFSTAIYLLPCRSDALAAARDAAQSLLEADLPGVQVSEPEPVDAEGSWIEDGAASMFAVLCPGTIQLADPRGRWPQHWPGSLKAPGLGSEPKAPFHWHVEMECKEGEVLLLPAWLRHRGGRSFALRATKAKGGEPLSWRLPRPSLCGWGLPVRQEL
ncbi:unnamed protein product, partial [Effrenium voratum]